MKQCQVVEHIFKWGPSRTACHVPGTAKSGEDQRLPNGIYMLCSPSLVLVLRQCQAHVRVLVPRTPAPSWAGRIGLGRVDVAGYPLWQNANIRKWRQCQLGLALGSSGSIMCLLASKTSRSGFALPVSFNDPLNVRLIMFTCHSDSRRGARIDNFFSVQMAEF